MIEDSEVSYLFLYFLSNINFMFSRCCFNLLSIFFLTLFSLSNDSDEVYEIEDPELSDFLF